MSAAAALAPTFWTVRQDAERAELADPSALVVSFAPSVVQIIGPRLLTRLSDNWAHVTPPADRCWFELRGGTGAASDANDVLAYSLTPDALTAICADGSALTFERSGLRFPQLDRALETDLDAWRVLFVLYVGPFLAACALLDAPGLISKTVQRPERALGASAPPVTYKLVEADHAPTASAQREAWASGAKERPQ